MPNPSYHHRVVPIVREATAALKAATAGWQARSQRYNRGAGLPRTYSVGSHFDLRRTHLA